jgi:sortase (surface protein transpeptidase)
VRAAAAGLALVAVGGAVTRVLGAASDPPAGVSDATASAPSVEAASTPVVEVPAADEPFAPIVPPTAPSGAREPEPAPEVAPVEPPAPTAPVLPRRPPALLRIPAIGVEAATVPVGLESDGAMEIPSDVGTIGWYEPGEGVGVAPGQVGTAVLAGHVDSRTQGAGAFYYLRDLAVGDEVVVDHADGSSSTWRVTEVIQYAKDALPIDEVFVWDGPPRLALITCGGAFDWTVRSYTDNIVVHAEPVTVAADGPPSVPS